MVARSGKRVLISATSVHYLPSLALPGGTRSGQRQKALRLTDHYHRNVRRMGHRRADRAQKHSRESASTAAADNDELGRLRRVEQVTGRVVAHDPGMNGDVRVA